MSDTGPLEERVWESGWDEHSRAQRRRLASLTLAEKLAWLEEAHALVLRFHPQRPWAGHDTGPGAGRTRGRPE